MCSLLSVIVGPALSTGFSAGALLAIVRPAVGSSPCLLQDFGCTISGALAGEIIGTVGTYIVARSAAGNDRSVGAAVGLMTLIGGATGLAIGTAAGVVASVAISLFSNS